MLRLAMWSVCLYVAAWSRIQVKQNTIVSKDYFTDISTRESMCHIRICILVPFF